MAPALRPKSPGQTMTGDRDSHQCGVLSHPQHCHVPPLCSAESPTALTQGSITSDRQTDRLSCPSIYTTPAPVGNKGQARAAHRNSGRAHLHGFALATTARLSGEWAVWCRLCSPAPELPLYSITSTCPRGTLHLSRYLWLITAWLSCEFLEQTEGLPQD